MRFNGNPRGLFLAEAVAYVRFPNVLDSRFITRDIGQEASAVVIMRAISTTTINIAR